MPKNIYIAGPLFNSHEIKYLEAIAKELEDNRYTCFLPHRDQSGVDESELETTEMGKKTKVLRQKIFIGIKDYGIHTCN